MRLRSDQGDVFTDFDIQLTPAKEAPVVKDTRQSNGRYRIEVDRSLYGRSTEAVRNSSFAASTGTCTCGAASSPPNPAAAGSLTTEMRPWLVSIAAGLTAAAVAESAGAQSVSGTPPAPPLPPSVSRAHRSSTAASTTRRGRARRATDFTQRDPDEGKPATERTEVRLLTTTRRSTSAARMFDSEPALIARRLSQPRRRAPTPTASSSTSTRCTTT